MQWASKISLSVSASLGVTQRRDTCVTSKVQEHSRDLREKPNFSKSLNNNFHVALEPCFEYIKSVINISGRRQKDGREE